jgi:lysine-N-methylase
MAAVVRDDSQQKPLELVAPAFATRFRCIGPACEETCCNRWTITVDEDTYVGLEKKMSGAPNTREEFARGFRLVPDKERHRDRHALIVLDDKGGCHFHREGLCSLQQRYGAEGLPATCAIYPRETSIVRDRAEVIARPSCPEVARELLLRDDAMGLVEAPMEVFPRLSVQRWISDEEEDAYARLIDQIRGQTLQLLCDREVPLAGRLAWFATLAEEATPWFHRGVRGFDGERMIGLLERLVDPAALRAFSAEFEGVDAPPEIAVRALLRLVTGRLHWEALSLPALIQRCFSTYDPHDVRHTVEVYQARRDRLWPLIGPAFDRMLTNYSMQHVFGVWYTKSPDLGIYATTLFVRIALIKLLVFGHPEVAALEPDADPERAIAAIERVTVEVVSKVSRGIEHSAAFLAFLDREVPAELPSMAHAICLLKI